MVEPSPRTKISFVLLSICTDELISTPKRIKPLPILPYLSASAFLDNLTPPNKQSFKVKLEFKSHDHVPNS